ncbi:hypothetical protein AURDEDRAFT_127482 [Auricularia subglabra TFB-10046 SS5]|nr:hypothetical protein AURDEDRAFT_127482 [Auricularia subglabra TFB-10046 SS5]
MLLTTLPALLHASLFLFLLGLVLFFWGLDRGVSGCLIFISGGMVAFYASAGFLTYWNVECPFYIPLFRQLHKLLRVVDGKLSWWGSALSRTIGHRRDELDAQIISWLVSASPVQDVVSSAITALGAVPQDSDLLSSISSTGTNVWESILSATLRFYAYLHSPAVHRAGQGDPQHALDADGPAAYNYYRTGWSIIRIASFLQSRRTPGDDDAVTENAFNALKDVLYARPVTLLFHSASDMLWLNAQLVRALYDTSHVDDVRLSLVHFNQRDDLPPSPAHLAHTLHMLAALEQKRHVQPSLPAALSFLHRSMRQYGSIVTLTSVLDSLRALCVPYNVAGLPEVDSAARQHDVNRDSVSLYCHIIAHAADYRLCLGASGAQRDAFLHEDLTRIARTIYELDGMNPSWNRDVSELLASDWFVAMRWHGEVLSVFSFQVDYDHARITDAIRNLLLAAMRSNAVPRVFTWLTGLANHTPWDCLAILDPSRGENSVSLWRMLYSGPINAMLTETGWDGRYWNTYEVLAFLLRLAQRMREAPTLGADARELFAPDCIAGVLRILARTPPKNGDAGATAELDEHYRVYDDWPLLARSLIVEMQRLLPDAWPELRERLLEGNGDDLDLDTLSLVVREVEANVSTNVVR